MPEHRVAASGARGVMAHFRIRLGTAGLLVVIVALALALIIQGRQMAGLRAELSRKDQEHLRALASAESDRLMLLKAMAQATAALRERRVSARATSTVVPQADGPDSP